MCYDLAVAGMLHDLGKVRLNFYMNEKVEDEILAVDETRYMRMHPSIGYAILADYDYNQTFYIIMNIMMAPVTHIIW